MYPNLSLGSGVVTGSGKGCTRRAEALIVSSSRACGSQVLAASSWHYSHREQMHVQRNYSLILRSGYTQITSTVPCYPRCQDPGAARGSAGRAHIVLHSQCGILGRIITNECSRNPVNLSFTWVFRSRPPLECCPRRCQIIFAVIIQSSHQQLHSSCPISIFLFYPCYQQVPDAV